MLELLVHHLEYQQHLMVDYTTATSLTLTSNTGFAASNLSSRCFVKINNEIMFGTLSGSNINSLSRAQDSTTASLHIQMVQQ